MVEIGWTIDKGFELVKISCQIANAFRDCNENARSRFRDFAVNHAMFHTAFELLLDVLQKHGKPLRIPCYHSIQLTLSKCVLFLQKYGVLNEVTTRTTILHAIKFGVRTVQWTLRAQNVADLLSRELASFTQLLTLDTSTMSLDRTFEERVDYRETREQLQEILHKLDGGRVPYGNPDTLAVPTIPQNPHQAAHTEHTEDQEHTDTLARVQAACHQLEALRHLLESVERTAVELPTGDVDEVLQPSLATTSSVRLARHEIQSQYERFSNLHKRLQSVSRPRSDSPGDAIVVPDRASADLYRPGATPSIRIPHRENTAKVFSNRPLSHSPRSPTNNTPTLEMIHELDATPVSPSSARSHDHVSRSESNSFLHPRTHFDVTSRAANQYLAQFGAELEALDTEVPRSRRRIESVDGNNLWLTVTDSISVKDVWYSCGECSGLCSPALQYRRRSNGGLNLRIVCTGTDPHRLLFDQYLKSSAVPYPHIFNTNADANASRMVKVLGSNSALEVVCRGRKQALRMSFQPCYMFSSTEDHRHFQEVVFNKKLITTYNIRSLESSAFTGSPNHNVTVRIWRDHESSMLSISTYGLLVDKHGPIYYCERRDAFDRATKVKDRMVKLKVLDRPTNGLSPSRKRRASRDSSVSGTSGLSAVSSSSDDAAELAAKIERLEVGFHNTGDTADFLRVWNIDYV